MMMTKVPIDEGREHRITYEVVVDCYNDYEVSPMYRIGEILVVKAETQVGGGV